MASPPAPEPAAGLETPSPPAARAPRAARSAWIAPSILSADFARLGEEVEAVVRAGADLIHFDVMDNHFVPNLTLGPMVCKALAGAAGTTPIDVHLMARPVDRLIRDFADAGAAWISIHPEGTDHPDRSLALIRDLGCKAGLVLSPATPLAWLDWTLDRLDLVLVMSVNPGFGGQSFLPAALAKLRAARAVLDRHEAAGGPPIRLEVDGASRPTISGRSRRPAQTRSWRARRSSDRGTTPVRSRRCEARRRRSAGRREGKRGSRPR